MRDVYKRQPFRRQQKGIVQQLVDLMEGGAGEGALLLLGREVSPLAAHVLPARGLAQGVVQLSLIHIFRQRRPAKL